MKNELQELKEYIEELRWQSKGIKFELLNIIDIIDKILKKIDEIER